MQCYSELLPPSGVTSSIHVAFTSSHSYDLVVAKTSLLQIFSFDVASRSKEGSLNLVAEFQLHGTIVELGKVNLLRTKSGGEALLVSFRDAKLSLIEWDPDEYSISTISIHYYENHDLLLCPWAPDLSDCASHLAVDPSSRCAAFRFNNSNLAIIPFNRASDDLALDDGFSDDEDTKQTNTNEDHQTNGTEERLFSPSFVLPMTALDPVLQHPIAMAFLHEYREATLGVLFSTAAASMNMAPVRKDNLSYAVYTLDIEQRASTTLLSVTQLPNDLHQIVPVPGPIGGTLLFGGNEIIHIDQGGKTNALAVNEMSKKFTSFPMADQSNLQLRLENCRVQLLDGSNTDVLLVLNDGSFAVLNFRLDGRSVSGLTLQKLDLSLTSYIFQARCSTMTALPEGHLFFGSEEADSVLVGTARKVSQLRRVNSRSYLDDTNGGIDLENSGDSDDTDADDDDDDIYGDSNGNTSDQQGTFDAASMTLRQKLYSVAPINDVVLGRGRAGREATPTTTRQTALDLLLSCNKGVNGSLAFLSQTVTPRIIKTFQTPNVTGLWCMSTESADSSADARAFDDHVVVTDTQSSSQGSSTLLSLGTKMAARKDTNFEQGDYVVATGVLTSGSYAVVYSKDIRTYDSDFGLDQILAIVDEDTESTARAVHACITGSYILVLKSDRTYSLFRTDKSGDLDEVDLPEKVPNKGIVSACLYQDYNDYFETQRFATKKSEKYPTLVALLTDTGSFSIHTLHNLDVAIFEFSGLQFLPHRLSLKAPVPKHWRNQDELLDMIITTLGPISSGKPYLLVRNRSGDITIYEPYTNPEIRGSVQFKKLSCKLGDPRETYVDTDNAEITRTPSQMVAMYDVGGSSVVITTGQYPKLISRSAVSLPTCHSLGSGPIRHISPFHDSSCNRGFVYASDDEQLFFCEMPADTNCEFDGWAMHKVGLGAEVIGTAYYPRTGSFVVATAAQAPFHLPRDDEWHPEWDAENEDASPDFLPQISACSLKLVSSATHSVISTHNFAEDEQVLNIQCINVEVSEVTHERRDLIVVGTGIARGENVVTRGNLYLFDVVDVVPDPDIAETDLKLKLVAKEDVRGAVTAVSPIGTQGLVLAAQGQKCMVRGLREDNAILPVAFMDMRYHVSVAKELSGTGLTILGDAFSGLWLIGYSEEPYKMQLLGRDLGNLPVSAADFLPIDKQLYIVASNDKGELRMLQYDPDDPRTERGSILLQRSTFNASYLPTMIKLLPKAPSAYEAIVTTNAVAPDDSGSEDGMNVDSTPLTIGHQVLIVTKEGAIATIVPVNEASYRRLSTMQTVLLTQLDQPCGLNPRAHRAIETDGVGGRATIDGQVVKRWLDQSSQHKLGLADRAGATVWDIKADLDAVSRTSMLFL